MSITTAQIRGARGILNWSQSDLAERTGISATSIGSIENNQSTPRESTLKAIRQAFENSGVEFIGKDGIKLRSGEIRTYSGQPGFLSFFEDVYKTIQGGGTEVLVSNVNERDFVRWLGEHKDSHVQRMNSIKDLTFKILVRDGDDFTPAGSYAHYRMMPQELFSSVPFYAYGDKLAILLFDVEPTIIVLDYPSIAAAYRIQFSDIWSRSKEISQQPAKQKSHG